MATVTETRRAQLRRWADEHMGKDNAETLMDSLPPNGWGDIATKADVARTEESVHARIDRVEESVHARIDRVEERITHESALTRAEISASVSRQGTRLLIVLLGLAAALVSHEMSGSASAPPAPQVIVVPAADR